MKTLNPLKAFRIDDDGASTAWSIFWTIIFLLTGGLVIDVANAYRYRAALQATADATSIAALMTYKDDVKFTAYMGADHADKNDPVARSKTAGFAIANKNMDPVKNKTNVTPKSDIELGRWDGSSFTPSLVNPNSARVTAQRSTDNGNSLDMLLLNAFTSLSYWDVGAVSIAEAYKSGCAVREGIMAGNILQISSNNLFEGELCLHGEIYVDLQNGNVFEDETGVSYGLNGQICKGFSTCGEDVALTASPTLEGRISQEVDIMPNLDRLFADVGMVITDPVSALSDPTRKEYIPPALVATRDADGYPATLHTGALLATQPSMTANQFNDIISAQPDPVIVAGKEVLPEPFAAYRHQVINVNSCTGNNKTLRMNKKILISDVVIKTECQVKMDADLIFQNSFLYTTSGETGNVSSAVSGSAAVRIGTGTCAEPYGGSHIFAAGDIKFAGQSTVEHSQLLSLNDVEYSAQPDASEGTLIWAKRNVKITSLGHWNGCIHNPGVPRAFVPDRFRIVF